LQSELLWRIKDAEELLKSRVPEVKVVKMIDELKLVLANQVIISTDKNKNFIEESVKEVYKTITKLSEGTETSLDDLRLIVRAQEKKINYDLATRDQIKALEMQDSQIKQQLQYEMEQMQQFIREMNVRVADVVGKMRALEAMKV
jgi:hypothetical protein